MELFRIAKQYLKAMYADWISRFSGIASAIFIVFASYFKWQESDQANYWLVAAIVCFVIASVCVWYRDRPRTRITIQDSFLTLGTVDNPHHIVTFDLYIVNRKPNELNAMESFQLKVCVNKKLEVGKLLPYYLKRDVQKKIVNGGGSVDYSTKLFRHNEPDYLSLSFYFADQLSDISGTLDFEREMRGQRYNLTIIDVCGQPYRFEGSLPLDWTESIAPPPAV